MSRARGRILRRGGVLLAAGLLLAACAGTAPPEPGPTGADAGKHWRPPVGVDWQWQLSGRIDHTVPAPVYDVDVVETSHAEVDRLHREGRKVICYVNVGAWEDFRPDREDFPAHLRGKGNGWEGERWLDIRRRTELRPLIAARFDLCKEKGFDAVEPDLVDGYRNETGFPLTAEDQLRYNRMVADLAHERGLGVGLKNDLPQIPELVEDFDFAVKEECAQYDECEKLRPFTDAGKAVLHAEYEGEPDDWCADSARLRLSSLRKHLDLGSWRRTC